MRNTDNTNELRPTLLIAGLAAFASLLLVPAPITHAQVVWPSLGQVTVRIIDPQQVSEGYITPDNPAVAVSLLGLTAIGGATYEVESTNDESYEGQAYGLAIQDDKLTRGILGLDVDAAIVLESVELHSTKPSALDFNSVNQNGAIAFNYSESIALGYGQGEVKLSDGVNETVIKSTSSGIVLFMGFILLGYATGTDTIKVKDTTDNTISLEGKRNVVMTGAAIVAGGDSWFGILQNSNIRRSPYEFESTEFREESLIINQLDIGITVQDDFYAIFYEQQTYTFEDETSDGYTYGVSAGIGNILLIARNAVTDIADTKTVGIGIMVDL